MIRVLFVCTGNTCRSPMAEAILKGMNLPDVEVLSAGVYASAGQPASEHACTVMKEKEMSHDHISRPLTQKEIDWATYIFTMTAGHKSLIADKWPGAMDKTFTLKEFVHDQPWDQDVADPFGGSLKLYETTYEELKALISLLAEKLRM